MKIDETETGKKNKHFAVSKTVISISNVKPYPAIGEAQTLHLIISCDLWLALKTPKNFGLFFQYFDEK